MLKTLVFFIVILIGLFCSKYAINKLIQEYDAKKQQVKSDTKVEKQNKPLYIPSLPTEK